MIHSIHATSATPVVLATQFKRDQPNVAESAETLVTLGRARQQDEKFSR